MSAETADALDSGADYIEANGWYNPNQKMAAPLSACATNAILWSADEMSVDAIHALGEHLGFGRSLRAIWDWNDAPERTEQEVLDALRFAAKQERIADDLGGVA